MKAQENFSNVLLYLIIVFFPKVFGLKLLHWSDARKMCLFSFLIHPLWIFLFYSLFSGIALYVLQTSKGDRGTCLGLQFETNLSRRLTLSKLGQEALRPVPDQQKAVVVALCALICIYFFDYYTA